MQLRYKPVSHTHTLCSSTASDGVPKSPSQNSSSCFALTSISFRSLSLEGNWVSLSKSCIQLPWYTRAGNVYWYQVQGYPTYKFITYMPCWKYIPRTANSSTGRQLPYDSQNGDPQLSQYGTRYLAREHTSTYCASLQNRSPKH